LPPFLKPSAAGILALGLESAPPFVRFSPQIGPLQITDNPAQADSTLGKIVPQRQWTVSALGIKRESIRGIIMKPVTDASIRRLSQNQRDVLIAHIDGQVPIILTNN